MTTLAAALLGLLALALATWAHYAFWRWRLAAPGREDEQVWARTADGWRLCLGRRRPRAARRGPPVLLIHGIAMNRLALDFGVERLSLAAHLAGAGLDCFALDLRGHGDSRGHEPGARRRWNLDDYLAQDLPAALDAVAAATGAPRVLLVGHSQGALLALAAAARLGARVAGVVALAPPIRFTPHAARHLRALPWLARLPVVRLAARMLAPFVGLWHPASARLSICPEEMEGPAFRRLMANVIEDLHPGVVDQFEAFIREDRCGSADGREDWRAALSTCRAPALFVAAPEDGIATPAIVGEACERWGGEKDLVVLPAGIGHTDMLLGRRAPGALFPAVRDWVLGLPSA
ncbi:MAG: alpha/beta hydrolase [Anaeromyxobacteraceae bacterium]|nr:alpha/beta hydrolase [Anaeromyxobacteraceae bacterium]